MNPEPYVFAKLIGHEMSWEEYGEDDPDFEYDPEAHLDYRLILQGTETTGADYNLEGLNTIVIQRISDQKFFKATIHWDSWSSLDYNSLGDYGSIREVKAAYRVVYE